MRRLSNWVRRKSTTRNSMWSCGRCARSFRLLRSSGSRISRPAQRCNTSSRTKLSVSHAGSRTLEMSCARWSRLPILRWRGGTKRKT